MNRLVAIPGAALLLLVLGFNLPAHAADLSTVMPLKAPPSAAYQDWTGLYVGGHVGYSQGLAQVTLVDSDPAKFSTSFGTLTGGLQLGYNYLLRSRILLGVEADISFPNYLAADEVAWFRTTNVDDVARKIDYMGTLRARAGYAFDHWMVYVTGGFAWSLGRFLQTPGVVDDVDKVLHLHAGWAIGAGAELPIAPSWTARLEYLYRNFGQASAAFPSGTLAGSSFDIHTVRIGLNYRPDAPVANASATGLVNSQQPQFDNWEVHGQTTYIQQGYPAFHSPYIGPQSFTPWPQTRNTWTTSLFLGLKLWDGGELYCNPELLQGFGLESTMGAAGFPNGEAQKSSFLYPRYNSSRLFLRQTFGLGGEEDAAESGYGQMAGKRDTSRLTIQIGKFAVHDVFDTNSYATDPRSDFLNWSIWAAGAFDYPADKVGLGWGAVAELNQKHWAVRAGYFLTGNVPNSNEFDMAVFRRGTYVGELETRYALFGRAGKLRVGIWADTYFTGSYSEALDLVALNPSLDPTTAIMMTRDGRTKYGYYLNFEQSLTHDVGVFGRWSWNNGETEISAFTDIDASLSLGTVISGKAWGRPDDKVGIAGVVNALSKDHRDYLAAGGLGILIGDGQLNYRPERVLETFYAMKVATGITLTFDYQFMINPADNADRGPISIFSARVHGEF
jgi:high affinity Mn2+ porin